MSNDKTGEPAFQTIMPVKPRTITKADKALLKEIGVIVIEHAEPETIRLITPMNEADHGAMLKMALKALSLYEGNTIASNMREYFGRLVMKHVSE